MAFPKGHGGMMNGKPLRTHESYVRGITKFWKKRRGKLNPVSHLGSGMKGRKHSKETKEKIGRTNSEKQRGKPKPYLRKKHHKTDESKIWRKRVEYRLWREAVFARDNWRCRKCKKRGVYLHPHHVRLFSKFPELRFAVNNGVTMCVPCHKEVHRNKDPKWIKVK